jgi:tetratricopeptide (TPR) repeat protein
VAVVLLVLLLAAPGEQARSAVDLSRSGWNAIRAGRIAEAAEAFTEALRVDPRNPRLLLGAGVSAHLLGREQEARLHLGAALDLQPGLTDASLLLGELLYRAADLDGAIRVYEQALVHAPEHERLATRLEAWRKEAALHGAFMQRWGTHFSVLFEGPREERLATRAVETLDAAYWRIGAALGTYPPEMITVVLYTREQFRDITRTPDWAGGMYDGRIRVPVRGAGENLRELDRVLAHELTHALVRSLAPRGVPQWLNEGLAVIFEGTDLAREAARLRGAPTPLPLSSLETSFEGLTTQEARLAYAQSALAAQKLIELSGPNGVFHLLTDLAAGVPFAEAFERYAFVPYEEFQKTLYTR